MTSPWTTTDLLDLNPPAAPMAEPSPALRQRPARTITREAGRLSLLADALGPLEHDVTIHLVSMADWSTHHILAYLLERIGQAQLHLATWSVSENAFRSLLELRQRGAISSITCVFDWRLKARNPKAFQLVRAQSDHAAVLPCHAKVFVLRNREWAWTCAGSANLTTNPRVEVQTLTEGRVLADWHAGWIDDLAHHRRRLAALPHSTIESDDA